MSARRARPSLNLEMNDQIFVSNRNLEYFAADWARNPVRRGSAGERQSHTSVLAAVSGCGLSVLLSSL